MSDTTSLSKWTKEKLVSEVLQLGSQKREKSREKLKKELQHQREFYSQA